MMFHVSLIEPQKTYIRFRKYKDRIIAYYYSKLIQKQERKKDEGNHKIARKQIK